MKVRTAIRTAIEVHLGLRYWFAEKTIDELSQGLEVYQERENKKNFKKV